MRALDPDLAAALAGGATTLCRCWRLRRQDGVSLGFTDHDAPLSFEGTTFKASSGLDARALQTGTGLSVDNAQAVGALTDAAITEADIRAGRYDRAEVDHWLVDWTAPARRVHLFRGRLGEIRRSEAGFEAELRGLAEALNMPVGRTLMLTCDRVLGDAKCRVDLDAPAYAFETEVFEAPEGGRIVILSAGGFAADWFAFGVIHWLSGANVGGTGVIKTDRVEGGRRHLVLAEEAPLPIQPGDRLRLTAGCDKRAETCRMKFNNFLNFRGFPHIPGEDWILAYPKDGEAHDGGSLARF